MFLLMNESASGQLLSMPLAIDDLEVLSRQRTWLMLERRLGVRLPFGGWFAPLW
jgi:hypothetical protein